MPEGDFWGFHIEMKNKSKPSCTLQGLAFPRATQNTSVVQPTLLNAFHGHGCAMATKNAPMKVTSLLSYVLPVDNVVGTSLNNMVS